MCTTLQTPSSDCLVDIIVCKHTYRSTQPSPLLQGPLALYKNLLPLLLHHGPGPYIILWLPCIASSGVHFCCRRPQMCTSAFCWSTGSSWP